MNLSDAINKAKTIRDFNDIFYHRVHVRLAWTNDLVTVDGYEGAVTTDFVAHAVLQKTDEETQDSKKLAALLAEKIFYPLRQLVEAPENQCSIYQLFALKRLAWTPPQSFLFGRSIALKHAMVLGFLDSSKY